MSFKELPQDYVLCDTIDLKNNKKQFWTVNGLSLALFVAVAGVGVLINAFYIREIELGLVQVLVFILSLFAYVVLHEAVHGMFMLAFAKVKPRFGYNVIFAWAGSSAYFDKKQYVIIALAPLVIWGVVLGILSAVFCIKDWFWMIWLLQAMNISGASGDIYVSCKMIKYPKDILVNDTGMSMTVYRKEEAIGD